MGKTIECPGCAMEVDHAEEVCPICGYEFPKQSLSVTIMVIVMIVLMVFFMIF